MARPLFLELAPGTAALPPIDFPNRAVWVQTAFLRTTGPLNRSKQGAVPQRLLQFAGFAPDLRQHQKREASPNGEASLFGAGGGD